MADKVGSLFFTLGVNTTEFQKKLNGATASLNQFGKNAQQVGRQMSMAFTLPMAAIGGASAKMAMDFEANLAKIEGLVGVAGDEVQEMGKAARSMAKDMGKSANEAAEALFFITSAGLRGADAMNTLEASLKASAIGLGETKVVADLATSALNAYGAANLSATQATDVMVAAVREGKLEANELAGSMGRVLPIASALGVSFNDVGAAFAALSRTGTNAAEAATQIRGIFASLLKPSKQAEEALAGMGLSAEGLRKSLREDGLLATLEILKKNFEGNDEAAAQVFGNIRALSGVMDLLGSNVDTTRAIFERMADTTGSLDAAFGVTEQTAKFRLNKAIEETKSGMMALGQTILESAIPMLEKLGKVVAALGQWFSELSPTMKTVIVAMGAIVAAAGPVLLFLGTMATMIPIVTTAFLSMNAAMAASPLGAMAMLVGALAAAFGVAYIKTKDFDKSTNEAATSTHALEKITRELTAAEKELAKAKSAGKDITDESTKSIVQETSARIKQAESIIASLKAQRAELEARMGKLTNPTFGLPSKSDINKASDLAEQIRNMDAQIKESEMTILRMAETMYDLGAGTKAVAEETDNAIKPTKELTEAQKKQLALQQQLQNFAGNKALVALTEDLTRTMGKAPTRFFEKLFGPADGPIKNLTTLKEKLIELYTPLGQTNALLNDLFTKYAATDFDPLKGLFATLNDNPIEGFQDRIKEALQSTKGSAEEVIPVFQALGQALSVSLQGASAGWVQFAANVVSGIGVLMKAAKVAVAAYKAKAVAAAIAGGAEAGASTGPLAPFTTPAFIATLLGVVGGAIAAIPKFAKGGAVTGPTLAMVGENPASRGEAIIPFERMGSFLSQFANMGGNGMQQVMVTGQIAGDTIRLSNQKSGINNGRVRWDRGVNGRALVN
jgi:TP901 family phage tail tape measure protein